MNRGVISGLPISQPFYVGARARRQTVQTFVTGSTLPVTFEVTDWDTHGFVRTQGTKFIVPFPGKYALQAWMNWAANTSADRQLLIRKNGNTNLVCRRVGGLGISGWPTDESAYVEDVATPLDYYEMVERQGSGSTLSTVLPGPAMSIQLIELQSPITDGIRPIPHTGLPLPRYVGAKMRRTALQGITGSGTISWQSVLWDTDGFWTISDPTKLRIGWEGYYRVAFYVRWTNNSVGRRILQIAVNGTVQMQEEVRASGNGETHHMIIGDLYLQSGDVLTAPVAHSAAGTINVEASDSSPWLSVRRLGP